MSGLSRTPGKRVQGNTLTGVRIPPSPPAFKKARILNLINGLQSSGFFHLPHAFTTRMISGVFANSDSSCLSLRGLTGPLPQEIDPIVVHVAP